MQYNIEHIANAYSENDLATLGYFAKGLQDVCNYMLGSRDHSTTINGYYVCHLARTEGTIGDQIRKLRQSMIDLEYAVKCAQVR